MKKVSIFVVIIVLFSLLAPISIAQSAHADYLGVDIRDEPSSSEMTSFISYISLFFESGNLFAAIDFYGNDISDEFYDSYSSLFISKSFEDLKEIADIKIAYLQEKIIYSNNDQTSLSPMLVPITHNVYNYRNFITQPPAPFSSQEYGTMLTSSFVADPFSDNIISAQRPALTVYHDGGGVYPHELSNVIIYAPIKNSGKVTFSASFSLYKVVGVNRYFSGSFTHTDTYNSVGQLV